MRKLLPFAFALLAACSGTPPVQEPVDNANAFAAPPIRVSRQAVENMIVVVETVEPVAEAVCKERAPTLNCDFQIGIDETPGAAPNAFQTQDSKGRPVIAFTVSLLAEARNQDELAFIMSHEASHHILGHIVRQNENARAGAQILGSLAYILSAGSEDSIRRGVQLGAEIGARTYSKDFELEADALGTRIAARAGFDPLKGAEFFFRIPDPGNTFLGSHPANAARVATVQRVAMQL